MEIAIALDAYDDLFSDFDIRGYAERALSKDFLDELRVRLRRHWGKSDLAIVFYVPVGLRSERDEELVARRLSDFFAERRDHNAREDRKAKLKSLLFVAVGLSLSIAANLFARHVDFLPLFNDFLLIPSWFFVWSGFDYFLKREELGAKKKYYAAVSRAELSFRDIEENEGPRSRAKGAV